LNTLLAGVRRVNAGDLETTMPIQYRDEIGFLTESFNHAVTQQRDLIANLEEHVAERTTDLAEANVQLRHEMDERQAAQAQVLLQERALAAAEEREQLGRELHDGLGQVMGYLNLQAQTVETLLDQGKIEGVRTNLRQMAQAAQQAHTDVRSFILGFRAAARQSFAAALQDTVADFERQTGILVRLEAAQPWNARWLSPVAEIHLLRIIQEALNNVRKHAQARRVMLTLAQEGERLQVTVADDGVGFDLVSSSLRGAGFAPKQSHPVQEIASAPTTGLAMTPQEEEGMEHFGLANMHERAAQLCGSLVIESAAGQGTRVILECPIQTPCEPSAAPVRPLRVLLVDDHPMFLDGLRNLLIAHGMEVVGLGQDGLEAQTLARALRPDLIVMDLQMPGCDGLEATRRIKAEWPAARIVILTVSAQEEHLFAALQAGAAGYLPIFRHLRLVVVVWQATTTSRVERSS
jgi:signal transduction histidine kinase